MYIPWLPLLLHSSLTVGSAHMQGYKGADTALLRVWGFRY